MSDDVTPLPTTDALDEDGGRALVESWRASGLTGAAFCRQRNLRPQRLHYWRERLGYPMRIVRTGSPRTADVPSAPESSGFVQVVVHAPASAPTDVEIVVGDVVIRIRPGFDPVMLRSLVSALRGEA